MYLQRVVSHAVFAVVIGLPVVASAQTPGTDTARASAPSTDTIAMMRADLERVRRSLDSLRTLLGTKDSLLKRQSQIAKDASLALGERDARLQSVQQELDRNRNEVQKITGALAQEQTKSARLDSSLSVVTIQVKSYKAQLDSAFKAGKEVQDRRRWVEAGAMYNHRTPSFVAVKKGPASGDTLVIRNEHSGASESDAIHAVAFLLAHGGGPDNYTYGVGPLFGFGTRDVFKNYYLGATIKITEIYLAGGLNFHEFDKLQDGWSEGAIIPPGVKIPVQSYWKLAMPFASVGVDSDFLLSAVGRIFGGAAKTLGKQDDKQEGARARVATTP